MAKQAPRVKFQDNKENAIRSESVLKRSKLQSTSMKEVAKPTQPFLLQPVYSKSPPQPNSMMAVLDNHLSKIKLEDIIEEQESMLSPGSHRTKFGYKD